MKSKILAIVMTLIMACSMLTATAFADGTYVPSPEHNNTDVDPNHSLPRRAMSSASAVWLWSPPSAAVWLLSPARRRTSAHNKNLRIAP